ncbi:McrB family protein [Homoserinimonas sp. OAct 916]|uniref:McrB family protein n=1 Tax=Homoserinimonas sp. OAct 916 TaxID=2211450 RepID=UPI000DBE0F07|nr:AAA family ATPase [Homoserinimonas sp. OAct 916]
MTELTMRGIGPSATVEDAAWFLLQPSLTVGDSPILGRPTWTVENARLLPALVTGENADMGDRGFLDKLKDQLQGQSDDLIAFTAELLYVHALPLVNIRAETKIDRVERVLSWSPSGRRLPDAMRSGLELGGVFSGGTGFNMLIWQQMLWLCRFVETWQTADEGTREAALADPWAFGALAASTPEDQPAIRASLCYMVWPGYFEAVVNLRDRKRIRDTFAHEISGATGSTEEAVDRDLLAIRERIDAKTGDRIDWYDEPFRKEWSPRSSRSTAGTRAWLVRSKQGGAALTQAWLEEGFISLPASNLNLDIDSATAEDVRQSVESGYAHLTYAQRLTMIREYTDFVLRMHVDDVVVGMLDDSLIVGTIIDSPELVEKGNSRLRRGVAWSSSRLSRGELPEPLPGLLDGQGVVVDFTSALGVLEKFLVDAIEPDTSDEDDLVAIPPAVASVPDLPPATDTLAASLYIPRDDLQEILDLLQRRQQAVFYGPPGTGKTFIAQALGRHMVGTDTSRVRIVQFHPSYAYEDFFEGLRPEATDTGVTFGLRPGPLRVIADEAALAENAAYPYVLIIDEMNRGNLAKVFGELYYLLEYRNDGIRLQYSGNEEEFRLPKNLFIIGTMNTVDRSISLVDAAIRRRFPFVELHPSVEPIRSVLDKYLSAQHQDPLRARLLETLNARIDERDLQIGPSYLMKSEAATRSGLDMIWKYDILPLLEDHYYGQRSPESIREFFGLDALLSEIGTAESGIGPADVSAPGHIVADLAGLAVTDASESAEV